MTILECKNLTKEYYSGENVIKAVDDANLSFAQGEFCAVTGPSGSGKSTLLHVLSSLENPTSGEVIYNGESLKKYNDNQLSILRRYVSGMTYDEIAAELNITKSGVRWNIDQIVEKGGFENKHEMLAAVLCNKFIVTTLLDND